MILPPCISRVYVSHWSNVSALSIASDVNGWSRGARAGSCGGRGSVESAPQARQARGGVEVGRGDRCQRRWRVASLLYPPAPGAAQRGAMDRPGPAGVPRGLFVWCKCAKLVAFSVYSLVFLHVSFFLFPSSFFFFFNICLFFCLSPFPPPTFFSFLSLLFVSVFPSLVFSAFFS